MHFVYYDLESAHTGQTVQKITLHGAGVLVAVEAATAVHTGGAGTFEKETARSDNGQIIDTMKKQHRADQAEFEDKRLSTKRIENSKHTHRHQEHQARPSWEDPWNQP